MEYQTFENTTLDSNFIFVYTTFYKCTFRKVLFCGAKMSGSAFIKCTFDDVEFVACAIDDTNFENCAFDKAKFSSCSITHTNFKNCTGIETFRSVAYANRFMHVNYVEYCTGLDDVPLVCPKEGEFYAYKAVCDIDRSLMGIAKLRIPEDAKRSSGLGRKCRCDKAEVVDIWALDNPSVHWDVASSVFCLNFMYIIGQIVEPICEKFNENRWDECSSGIHFFMTEEEANIYATSCVLSSKVV